MSKQTRTIRYDFRGVHGVPAVGSGDGGPFVKAVTAAGGSPTVQGVSGGGIALALDNTNEAQNLCLYQGDVLPFDIDELIRLTIIAKLSASLPATVSAAIGLASARNDAIDTIANAALFRAIGSNSVVCETDDGTNDVDDAATGDTLVDTHKRLVIDFATGVLTQSPPAKSIGGKGDVQFSMSNANGSLRRVASGTAFNMSNYSGNLQLFAQLQKTASTDVATLTVLEYELEVKTPV